MTLKTKYFSVSTNLIFISSRHTIEVVEGVREVEEEEVVEEGEEINIMMNMAVLEGEEVAVVVIL